MKTSAVLFSLAAATFVLAREDFDWDCSAGVGSVQSCNNACFAVNCVEEFEDTTTYFMARYAEDQNRRDSGEQPNPNPCNDGWTGDNRWRVAGDRTSGGVPATELDEFPFASTSNGGTGARLRCVNPSDNRSGGAKFGVFLQRVGWTDPADDSNGAVDRSFGIFIRNYGNANFCGDGATCTNDGAEFHKDGANFVDGKRQINLPRYQEDVTPAKPVYKMRKFMGSDGEERLLLGRNNGTLPFEVGTSAEKTFEREDGVKFSLLYEMTE